MSHSEVKSTNYVEILMSEQKEAIKINSFHISCKSQFTYNEYITGIMFQYDGHTEWELNKFKCKTGYIYLCKSSLLLKPNVSKIAECFEQLFNISRR